MTALSYVVYNTDSLHLMTALSSFVHTADSLHRMTALSYFVYTADSLHLLTALSYFFHIVSVERFYDSFDKLVAVCVCSCYYGNWLGMDCILWSIMSLLMHCVCISLSRKQVYRSVRLSSPPFEANILQIGQKRKHHTTSSPTDDDSPTAKRSTSLTGESPHDIRGDLSSCQEDQQTSNPVQCRPRADIIEFYNTVSTIKLQFFVTFVILIFWFGNKFS